MGSKFLGFASPPCSEMAQTLAWRARGPGIDPNFPLIFPNFSPTGISTTKNTLETLGLRPVYKHNISFLSHQYVILFFHFSCKQNQEHVAESLFPVHDPDDGSPLVMAKLKVIIISPYTGH